MFLTNISLRLQLLRNVFLGNPEKSALLLRYLHVKYHQTGEKKYKLSDLFYRLNIALNGCDIHPQTIIGNDFALPHPVGVVIGKCTIGNNVCVLQNVTIGNNLGFDLGSPVIGDNVVICAGAVVFGSIKIGNNVRIGANAVVMTDVPDNCTVVGNPGRIILRE